MIPCTSFSKVLVLLGEEQVKDFALFNPPAEAILSFQPAPTADRSTKSAAKLKQGTNLRLGFSKANFNNNVFSRVMVYCAFTKYAQ